MNKLLNMTTFITMKTTKEPPYTFINAEKLLTDFWAHIDVIMSETEGQS
jgi:hypothetical protein